MTFASLLKTDHVLISQKMFCYHRRGTAMSVERTIEWSKQCSLTLSLLLIISHRLLTCGFNQGMFQHRCDFYHVLVLSLQSYDSTWGLNIQRFNKWNLLCDYTFCGFTVQACLHLWRNSTRMGHKKKSTTTWPSKRDPECKTGVWVG